MDVTSLSSPLFACDTVSQTPARPLLARFGRFCSGKQGRTASGLLVRHPPYFFALEIARCFAVES